MRFFERLDILTQKWLDWRIDREAKNNPEIADLGFTKIEMSPDGFVGEFISPAVAIFADECVRMLDKAQAKNYVQFDMLPKVSRGIKPIRVTVQWAHGESPAQQNERLRARENETCSWTCDDDGVWKSACGDSWVFETGNPTENKMRYCPFCGRKLAVVETAKREDEEEE